MMRDINYYKTTKPSVIYYMANIMIQTNKCQCSHFHCENKKAFKWLLRERMVILLRMKQNKGTNSEEVLPRCF